VSRRVFLVALLLAGCGSSGRDQAAPAPTIAATTTSTVSQDSDTAIRVAVAKRLIELHVAADPATVAIETTAAPRIAGLLLFRARYGEGEQAGTLGGTLDVTTGAVNALPNDALVRVWQRWIGTGGLPDATEVTRTSTFLIGAADRTIVVLTDADIARAADEPDRPKVRLPRLLERDQGQGVVFWRLQGDSLAEVTLRLAGDVIAVSERPA
jgi:hypothetical protein